MAEQASELATLFDQMADLLDIQGANYHRILAYRRGAEALRGLATPLPTLVAEGRLEEIPGIGETLAAKIREYLETGAIAAYDKLCADMPPSLLDLLQVQGLGPRRVARFWRELDITTLEQLEAAARDGQLQTLKGIGARTEHNIGEGIRALRRQRQRRVPLAVAWPLAQEIIGALQTLPEIVRIEPAGSLRRMRETVGDIDILVAAESPEPVMARFRTLPVVGSVLLSGPTKTSIRTVDGLQVDLRVLPPARWGAALQYFTGSQGHNIRLRELAQQQGLSLSEYGFQRADGSELLCANESEVYATLALPWIPPELREDRGEFAAAQAAALPRLVTRADLRGDFQCHTVRSDGEHTILEMARAAQAASLHYLVVCDHTSGLGISRGMTPDDLPALLADVAEVNAQLGAGFRVLAGAEVEIRVDGGLDWPNDALAQLDFVVASVHSGLNHPREELTERILMAMQNPYVDLIGHPTGRLLGRRPPADLDMEALFQAALKYGVALEVSAWPLRLDLSDVYIRRAVELGVMLAISSDAHDVEGFAVLPFGVAMARRGWAEPQHLLNTRPWAEVHAWRQRRLRVPG